MSKGLLDTSVWIAGEVGRPVDGDLLPEQAFICVITLAELQAAVLAAPDTSTRAARLGTLARLQPYQALPVDPVAAQHWASLRVQLHEAERAMGINDLWISAIAMANGLPVVTQDRGFDVLQELDLLEVIHV